MSKWADWTLLPPDDEHRRNGIGIEPIPKDLTKLPVGSEMEEYGSRILVRTPKRQTLKAWKTTFPDDHYIFYNVGKTKCTVPLLTQALMVWKAYLEEL